MGKWKQGMAGETLIPSCLVTSFLSITVEIRIWVLFPEYREVQFLDLGGCWMLVSA